MKRYTKPEVDSALEETERGTITPHSQIVLAGEVLALRLQYRAAGRCPVHNARMHIAVGGDGRFVCWRCSEGLRLEAQVTELTARLSAVTDCPADALVRDAHGRVHCQYRPIKQAQVAALQADNDRLRNELAQLRVEYHFLLEGSEPLPDCEHSER